MAARSDEVGESIAHENSSFYVVNGGEQQLSNISQDDGGHLPTMESMLEAATDLQSDHIDQPTSKISGRLEMRHDIVENNPAVPNAGRVKIAKSFWRVF